MLSSVTSSFPDTYSAEFFGALAANDESTPSDAPALGHTQAGGLVAQSAGVGGECPDVGHLCDLRWLVKDAHGGHMSNGYFVLLSLSHAHGGLSGCLDNTDRVQAYDSLLSAASRCIGAGC